MVDKLPNWEIILIRKFAIIDHIRLVLDFLRDDSTSPVSVNHANMNLISLFIIQIKNKYLLTMSQRKKFCWWDFLIIWSLAVLNFELIFNVSGIYYVIMSSLNLDSGDILMPEVVTISHPKGYRWQKTYPKMPEAVDLSTRRVTVGRKTYPKMLAAPPLKNCLFVVNSWRKWCVAETAGTSH